MGGALQRGSPAVAGFAGIFPFSRNQGAVGMRIVELDRQWPLSVQEPTEAAHFRAGAPAGVCGVPYSPTPPFTLSLSC